jgi:hypothetical protein
LLQQLVQFLSSIKQRKALHERSPNNAHVNSVRTKIMIRMARVRPVWINAKIVQVSAINCVHRDWLMRLWWWRRRWSCPSTKCFKDGTKIEI